MADAGSGFRAPRVCPRTRGQTSATGNFVTRKAEGYADDMPKDPATPLHRIFLALALLCGAVASNATTLYRWVDANGVTHWSDRPVVGSTPVEMGSAQGYRSNGSLAPLGKSNERAQRPDAFVLYTGIEILAPINGAVLFETGGNVECRAQLTPSLAPGHSIWFEIDGQRIDGHGALSVNLPAPRGTHMLRVLVIDAQGQEQITSAPVTFYVRQASIAAPPVGPTLKKPR